MCSSDGITALRVCPCWHPGETCHLRPQMVMTGTRSPCRVCIYHCVCMAIMFVYLGVSLHGWFQRKVTAGVQSSAITLVERVWCLLVYDQRTLLWWLIHAFVQRTPHSSVSACVSFNRPGTSYIQSEQCNSIVTQFVYHQAALDCRYSSLRDSLLWHWHLLIRLHCTFLTAILWPQTR